MISTENSTKMRVLIIIGLMIALGIFLLETASAGNQDEVAAFCDAVTEIPKAECEALLALYNSTEGDNWHNNSNWLQTYTPCSWYGVVCWEGSNVTALSLDSNNLQGTIPTELVDLTQLGGISMGDNQLVGGIPEELGSLTQLYEINFTDNPLGGSIPPSIGNLVNLEKIFLTRAELTGPIPPELGNLSKLTWLTLFGNHLNGNIPAELGNLNNLQYMYMWNNQLTGPIPAELGALSNLIELGLDENQLTGSIPPELGKLSKLQNLSLFSNQLEGSIPPELAQLDNLQYLGIQSNLLSGMIPMDLTALSDLGLFYFYDTDLCVPDSDTFQTWLDGIDDVLGTGVTCDGMEVVVLVHGWQALKLDWRYTCGTGITEYPNGAYWVVNDQNGQTYNVVKGQGLPNWLSENGYSVWFTHLDSNPAYTAPISKNAGCLKNQLSDPDFLTALAKDPDGEFTLIAHSMGGLVSREYIEGFYGYPDNIDQFITMGSPHDGIPSDMLDVMAVLTGLNLYCSSQPAICEMDLLSMVWFNLIKHPDPSIKYHLIAGAASLSDLNEIIGGLSSIIYFFDDDDGMVPTSSALFESHPSTPGIVSRMRTDEPHSTGAGDFSYLSLREKQPAGRSVTFLDCIEPLLSKSISTCPSTAPVSASSTGTRPYTTNKVQTPVLLPGETVTETLLVEAGEVVFLSSWVSGTVSMTLQSPLGITIDPAYAVTHPESVGYQQTARFRGYRVYDAEGGAWKLLLEGAEDIPPEGITINSLAAFPTTINLSFETDQQWYNPGNTIHITGTFDSPPSSATLTTEISYANGFTDTIVLSEVGGGVFYATLSAQDAQGFAHLTLTAVGTEVAIGDFTQVKNALIQIAPASLTLTGAYSETLNAGGVPDPTLEIHVGVDAVSASRYALAGNLVDGLGAFVAHSSAIVDLPAGESAVPLRFDGRTIFQSGLDGPYTLTNLVLMDLDGITSVVGEAEDVYQTAAYSHRDFYVNTYFLPFILH